LCENIYTYDNHLASLDGLLKILCNNLVIIYRYISIKEGCLFVCFVCHFEISQTMMSHVMLLVWFKSPRWGFNECDFFEAISYILEPTRGRYWILNNFLSLKINLKFKYIFSTIGFYCQAPIHMGHWRHGPHLEMI